ncbi:MAG: hypothetical protein AAFR38_05755 [Planctomycetota bacterium]
MPAPAPEILIDPPAREWAGLLSGDPGPRILSGHQPGLWHAGIAAKRIALCAACRALGGGATWLVVDHDDVDPFTVRYPETTEGGWIAATARLDVDRLVPPGTPAASRPRAERPPEVPPGFGRAVEALDNGAATAALQAATATESLLRVDLGLTGAALRTTTDFARLSEFVALVEMIRADPDRCVATYNESLGVAPGAHIRPLTVRANRCELPLWRLRPGEPRTPVYSMQLAEIPTEQLAPKAVLQDLFVRRHLADVFIHGTGGMGYAKVADRWAQAWLAESLAPAVCVSATLRLDLGVPDVTERQVADAHWRAHHAKHDPSMLGDPCAATEKNTLLHRIEKAKAAGEDPAPHFQELHELLDGVRREHPDRLAHLGRQPERLEALLSDAEIARDRTWPFVLHDPSEMRALHDEIEARFAAVGGAS